MQNATATDMDSNMPPNVDAEGFIVCPKCEKSIKVGSGGIHNLRAHQAGAKCRERIAKQAKAGLEVKQQQKFTNFFAPCVVLPKFSSVQFFSPFGRTGNRTDRPRPELNQNQN